jgi:hypothetical protein
MLPGRHSSINNISDLTIIHLVSQFRFSRHPFLSIVRLKTLLFPVTAALTILDSVREDDPDEM